MAGREPTMQYRMSREGHEACGRRSVPLDLLADFAAGGKDPILWIVFELSRHREGQLLQASRDGGRLDAVRSVGWTLFHLASADDVRQCGRFRAQTLRFQLLKQRRCRAGTEFAVLCQVIRRLPPCHGIYEVFIDRRRIGGDAQDSAQSANQGGIRGTHFEGVVADGLLNLRIPASTEIYTLFLRVALLIWDVNLILPVTSKVRLGSSVTSGWF